MCQFDSLYRAGSLILRPHLVTTALVGEVARVGVFGTGWAGFGEVGVALRPGLGDTGSPGTLVIFIGVGACASGGLGTSSARTRLGLGLGGDSSVAFRCTRFLL